MPAAAKLMADRAGAGQVAGTGKDGRVTKGDVLGAMAAARRPAAAPAVAPRSAAPAAGRHCRRCKAPIDFSRSATAPSSACRCRACAQRVAERLVQSQSTAAILTTFNEVNMAAGDGDAQPLQGPLREGARRQARLHVVLRQGGGARR
jgi:2-oxoglutarate dehydrogenase E2 component (dihydrolipoamide succinyltransferase)